jgi:hypothetical protein
MCCPGRVITGATSAPDQPRSLNIGETGLVEVVYSGIMAMSGFYGDITGVKYRFGTEHPRGFVDKRDLEGFLKKTEFDKKVFSEKLA